MTSGELSFDALTARQKGMLEHLCRHQLTFKEVLTSTAIYTVDPRTDLEKMKKQGWIQDVTGYSGNRKGITLTEASLAKLPWPSHDVESNGSASHHSAFGMLSFCFFGERRSVRVFPDEFKKMFGVAMPYRTNGCIELTPGKGVYRELFVPGASTLNDNILGTLRQRLKKAMALPELHKWIRDGLYRFTVLVEAEHRADDVRDYLATTETPRGERLADNVTIEVLTYRPIEELEDALKKLKQ